MQNESVNKGICGLQYECMHGDRREITRALWEKVFTEDSREFLDYYYTWKAPDNRVYVLKEQNRVVAMVHLSLYPVISYRKKTKAYYIVGVATDPDYRHRGCMDFLLRHAITDARAEKCPFVFLMPADRAIYERYGFQYGYAHKNMVPVKPIAEMKSVRVAAYEPEMGAELSDYANRILRTRYQTFCERTPEYFCRMQKELISEKGNLYVLYDVQQQKETVTGYFCFANEGAEVYPDVVLSGVAEQLFQPEEAKDTIMFLELGIEQLIRPAYFPEIV